MKAAAIQAAGRPMNPSAMVHGVQRAACSPRARPLSRSSDHGIPESAALTYRSCAVCRAIVLGFSAEGRSSPHCHTEWRFYVLTIRSGRSPSVIEGIPAWDYLAGILRQLPTSGSGAAVCLSVRWVRVEPVEDLLGVRVWAERPGRRRARCVRHGQRWSGGSTTARVRGLRRSAG